MLDVDTITTAELQANYKAANTLANAKAWNEDFEKFVFCVDMLDLSAWESRTDMWVSRLELSYMTMLEKEGIEVD